MPQKGARVSQLKIHMENYEIAVPLPNDVPPKLDLSHLPLPVLRAGSVEALINQNEDLMARLTVSLRRLALVEEENIRIEEEKKHLTDALQNRSDQLLIQQKKDEYWKEHLLKAQNETLRAERECDIAKQELSVMEIRYHEFVIGIENSVDEQNQRLKWAHRKIVRFQKYRAKIRLLSQQLRVDFSKVREKLEETMFLNQDVNNRLQASIEFTEIQKHEFQKKLNETISAYESKINQLSENEKELESTLQQVSERNQILGQLIVDQVELENKAISLKSNAEAFKKRWDKLENEHLELRKACELSQNEKKNLAKELGKLHQNNEELSSKNLRHREQVEGLQALWDDARKRIEDMISRENALQKLNEELSHQLALVRRELQASKDVKLVAQTRLSFSEHAVLNWLEEAENRLAQIESSHCV